METFSSTREFLQSVQLCQLLPLLWQAGSPVPSDGHRAPGARLLLPGLTLPGRDVHHPALPPEPFRRAGVNPAAAAWSSCSLSVEPISLPMNGNNNRNS